MKDKHMSSRSLQTAILGENAAALHLSRKDYRILHRNFRSKSGEIDIICENNGVIIFVEVKTRRSDKYGMPSEAVNYRKQQKIIATAMLYLNEQCLYGRSFRFDVVEVFINQGIIKYNHILNAFGR